MNENDAYIFDVEEPTQWVFAGEPVWIAGWFLSKTGAVFSDIRAVIDGVPHLGIFGLPREQIEQKYRNYFGLPHAGFLLRICPPLGATLLRLEILDAGQHWVEIWRTNLKVNSGPKPGVCIQRDLLPAQVDRLLQAHRANPLANLTPTADQLVAELATMPLETLPNPPFFGALENPLAFGGAQFGKVRVEGWIIHQEQRITRLLVSTHPLVENAMDYGNRERAEAGHLFPDHPYAARSQFFGMADISEQVPNPVCLKIFAELEDGTKNLIFVRRFQQRSCGQLEQPRPAFSRALFLTVMCKLFAACRRQNIKVGPLGTLWPAVLRAYRNFHRDAPPLLPAPKSAEDSYRAWQHANRLTPRLRQKLENIASNILVGPSFALLIDVTGCTPVHLSELITSLKAQIYPRWEVWFIGGNKELSAADARCKTEHCTGLDDFTRALNSAADQISATHLTLLSGHSRLTPDALLEIAECLITKRDLALIYTDEDRMDNQGRQTEPQFKPNWSPALALSGLFPGHLSFVCRKQFIATGAFRSAFNRVPWYDVLLRISDRLTPDNVAHVPLVCHHARAEVASPIEASDPCIEQARLALTETMIRRGWAAAPFRPETAHDRRLCYHQLRWDGSILAQLPVTIVIPTRDKLHLLQECIELLDETVDWRYVKLIIVDDHSRDADAVHYLTEIQRRTDLRCSVIRPIDYAAPFNYAHLVNLSLPHIDTPLILHLNNDVNALERGWLEEMVGWFTQPDVGVVGAKLVYPDKTLNHTGIIIGPHGGLADTPYAKIDEHTLPAVEWFAAAREVSAVTGACLMTRTAIYQKLDGFDEVKFSVSYNDVDYCLRTRMAGYRVIYTPQAKLMHWGSATRGVTFDDAEHIAFIQRYPAYRDPYLSAHLHLVKDRLFCSGAINTRTHRAGNLKLLLLTHNLNLEGAPLFLLEYATYMTKEAGCSLQILASQDGPLRSAYENLGAQITIVEAGPLYAAPDQSIFNERLSNIAQSIDWKQVDLVICNTIVSFWGVHLARLADKPSLFYIHESTSIFRFFEQMLRLELHQLVSDAFSQTTNALFLCAATQAYYVDHNRSNNFRLVPSWIQIEKIEQFRSSQTRAALRRKHGFQDDEIIIANIGTVCERKGQHIFVRAIQHFNQKYSSNAPIRFVMVGARPGIYLDLLKGDIAKLKLPNVTLVPETREVFDFFLLADLFVCSSFEESFPRVIMEAMVFRTPIITTDVHGIVDILGQRQEGYLVKPGDVAGLAQMMHLCLTKERSGRSLTPTAYSKALRFYDYHKVLPHHVALARAAVLEYQ